MLSDPRAIFGLHAFSPYNRVSGEYYGTVKCIGKAALSNSGELVELRGGASRYPYAAEDGAISAELSLMPKSFESFLFTLFLGKAPTDTGADTAGTVSTLTNKYGTSAKSATTGIATVTVKSAAKADLKFSKYVVKVVTATTVDVYAGSDVDFIRGTDLDFVNDLLKVTTTPLTITASTGTDIPSVGLTLTGGSGTIGMTAGDTATFSVLPPSTKSMAVVIGGTNDIYPEFGTLLIAQRRGNQEMTELDIFRAKGIGLPLGFEEKKWADAEIKAKCMYDATLGGVFSVRHITLND